jgi:tetratricopeptide (TPR) repeat protein
MFKYVAFLTLLLWRCSCFSADLLHTENTPSEWDSRSFQARVLGVYDWIEFGPELLTEIPTGEPLLAAEEAARAVAATAVDEKRRNAANNEKLQDFIDRPDSLAPIPDIEDPGLEAFLEGGGVRLHATQIPTANRDLRTFPARVRTREHAQLTLPKDWLDRIVLINYFLNNAELDVSFFEAMTKENASADTHYLLGNIYYLGGNYAKALASYTRATEDFDQFRLAYRNMAYSSMQLGNCGDGLAYAREATKLGTFNAFLNGIIALCSLQKGDYHSASVAIANARVIDNKNELWRYLEIETLLKLKKYQQVQAILSSRSGQLNSYFDFQTAVYRGLGDKSALLANLEIKKRMKRITAQELNELSGLKSAVGLFNMIDDAQLDNYLSASTPSLTELTEIFYHKADEQGWQTALSFILQAIETLSSKLLPKEKTELAVLKATAWTNLGQLDSAENELDRLLLQQPLHCSALLLKATILSDQKQFERAAFYSGRAENGGFECRNRAVAQRARTLLDRGEYAASLNLYRVILQQNTLRSGSYDGVFEKTIRALFLNQTLL